MFKDPRVCQRSQGFEESENLIIGYDVNADEFQIQKTKGLVQEVKPKPSV